MDKVREIRKESDRRNSVGRLTETLLTTGEIQNEGRSRKNNLGNLSEICIYATKFHEISSCLNNNSFASGITRADLIRKLKTEKRKQLSEHSKLRTRQGKSNREIQAYKMFSGLQSDIREKAHKSRGEKIGETKDQILSRST